MGDHIRKARLDRGLLQKDVAQILKVHATTVQFWENRNFSPALPFLPRVVAFLGYVPWAGPPKHIGEKIARARRWLGITQEELAREAGIDPGTLAKWEKGKCHPSEEPLARIEPIFSRLMRGYQLQAEDD